jgi:hypothetical protein
MPISKRYECILAVLNDPINRAIVEREILRRSENLIPPPVILVGGGFVYLTMDEYRRKHRECVETGEDPDTHAEVFGTPGEWYVAVNDAEIGPFSSITTARIEAENLLKEQGLIVLRDHPWTKDDAAAYPLSDAATSR